MAETTTTTLNPDAHLLLDQPLLRLPLEVSRKNFKAAQRAFERERDALLSSLKAAGTAALSGDASAPASLESLDASIAKLEALKKRLATLAASSKQQSRNSRARIEHLGELYKIPSLVDVKYDEWARVRLDRLLVDYLLRFGYGSSAAALAREKGIAELVDVEAFVTCQKIERSLREGRTAEALAWCGENKQSLKKLGSDLEFQLRLQQYIELVRTQNPNKIKEATMHARKYLASHSDIQLVTRAACLLAFPPNTPAEPYRDLYSPNRWTHLTSLFLSTHHNLLSLPSRPLLHIALSAGLSALKTPACHSTYTSSSSNASSTSTSVCPICSTELNELARNVPYAQHSKSEVEHDPVVLPNGRIYGRERLRHVNEKMGTAKGMVRDPTDMKLFEEQEIKKVFIS
ncbi:hypothetical protein M501DRAFT_1046243 [Patellaria atrata CBS 101060]|uniref:Protein FYV10 n=1 Tax=Patellaria atrata CBS 101060 TaxID=1346257 RepID=A0A9P4VTZ3_9PEZI|nr:hypothetical protein M501DRAFT_1046243 [Patellaria atrata CBS 101060]